MAKAGPAAATHNARPSIAPRLVALLPPVLLPEPLPPPTATILELAPEAQQPAPPPWARSMSAVNSLRLRPASTPPSISPVKATTWSCPTRSRWGTMGSSVATAMKCVAPMTSGLPATAVQQQREKWRNAAISICFASSTYDPAHRDPGYGLSPPTRLTK